MLDETAHPTLVLLDIDGSTAPTTTRPTHGHPVVFADAPPGRMHVRVDLLEALGWLHDDSEAEVAWLTSWHADEVAVLAEQLRLPRWRTHARRDAPGPAFSDWWKERTVMHYLRQGRRVVWVDDEIPYRGDVDWLNLRWPGQLIALGPEPSSAVEPAALLAAVQELAPRR